MKNMSDDNGPPPLKRVKLSLEAVHGLSKEELLEKWQEQEAFIDALITKNRPIEDEEVSSLRESEEKLKTQQTEASRRENVLVMRLAAKEQEMQEYVNQIQELKQAQNTSAAQLRTMLLDPAINIMFQRMKKEMDASKEKLEQAQNDLAAWKFTPDSQTGKRLMAKCRMLLQENEELGKVISSGRTAKLEGEIALEKTLVQEMKKSQAEMDEFLLELDEDVEGMQSTIYLLQQQLKEAKDQISQLQEENAHLRGNSSSNNQPDSSKLQEMGPGELCSSSNRSTTPTSITNALDAHMEPDERGRTRHVAEEKQTNLSPTSSASSNNKAGFHHHQRTSKQQQQSPTSSDLLVSSNNSNNHRDHQQQPQQLVGSQHYNERTADARTPPPPAAANGGGGAGVETMDTSGGDGGAGGTDGVGVGVGGAIMGFDADSTTSGTGDHHHRTTAPPPTHRHFTGSHNKTQTTSIPFDGSSSSSTNNRNNKLGGNNNIDVNNHHHHRQRDSTTTSSSKSNVDYVITENTDVASSDDVDMIDDDDLRTDLKGGRTVVGGHHHHLPPLGGSTCGGVGGEAPPRQTMLLNGLVETTPLSDSPTDDDGGVV